MMKYKHKKQKNLIAISNNVQFFFSLIGYFVSLIL